MYCTYPSPEGPCDAEHEASRRGIPAACTNASNGHACVLAADPLSTFPMEDLLYQYGVDLAIYGHIHDYERFYPVYNLKLTDDPFKEPYVDPHATVHMTTGAGGTSLHANNMSYTG